MAKLSKQQAQAHARAMDLVTRGNLTHDEKFYVLEHFHEGANHINSNAGAFFTPVDMAADLVIEYEGASSVVDLCAGIGRLAFFAFHHARPGTHPRIVCVESNPDYVRVGRAVLPEAEWIVGDVLMMPDLGHLDVAISNPPFGAIRSSFARPPRSTQGRHFEYSVIDVASDIADFGVFILPQNSVSYRPSRSGRTTSEPCASLDRFFDETGIQLDATANDTRVHADGWRDVSIACEIVTADFVQARSQRPGQKDLFGIGAGSTVPARQAA